MTQRAAVLVDARIVTALGDLDETWQALLGGHTAVGPIRRFDVSRLDHRLAACAPWLAPDPAEGTNHVNQLLRRVVEDLPPLPHPTPILWAGVKGDAESIERRSPESHAPLEEPWRPEHYRRRAAHALDLDPDRGFDVNAACAASTVALAQAAQLVADRASDVVLVLAADAVTAFTHRGFAALKALTPVACRPFDRRRDGLVLGDGAAALVVASPEAAERMNRPPLARIAGAAIANDATHITAPARDARGLRQAVARALEQAACSPDDVEAFCAHGTATVYNDAMELTAIDHVFGSRPLPTFSAKGAVGHTLGAAGAIEAALAVRCLRDGVVPPTVGCEEPEAAAANRVAAEPREFPGRRILTTNSGFGGVNAAIILETAP